jgi:hypothetical protein
MQHTKPVQGTRGTCLYIGNDTISAAGREAIISRGRGCKGILALKASWATFPLNTSKERRRNVQLRNPNRLSTALIESCSVDASLINFFICFLSPTNGFEKTHYDGYNNTTQVLTGRKVFYILKEPWVDFANIYNPVISPLSHPALFQRMEVVAGSTLVMPAYVGHYVESDAGTVSVAFFTLPE